MNRIFRYLLLTVAFLAASTAIANPINVIANRRVEIGDLLTGPLFGPNSPSTAPGVFIDSVNAILGPNSPQSTLATQDSGIDAGAGNLYGNGHAQVDFSVLAADEVYAESFFDVFFDITTDHAYSLTGELNTFLDGGGGLASFQLIGPTGLSYSVVDYEPDMILASSGVLTAGSYQLTVVSRIDRGNQPDGYMGGWVDFNFNMNMRPIDNNPLPEPATFLLMMLGLAGLGLRKRR